MRFLILPLLALLSPATALAQSALPAFLPTGPEIRAPFGYREMCATDPALCQSFSPQTPAAAPALASTPDLPGQATAALRTAPPADRQAAPLTNHTTKDERALSSLAHSINLRVNRRVIQQSDQSLYGRAELWRPAGSQPGARGDCEDIALQKRLELLAAGFPPDRLFMAVVSTPAIGLHAILLARMSDGDLVLDSRHNLILPWQDTGYTWVSAQSPQDPARWFAVPR